MSKIAEGFGAPGPSRRKRAHQIAAGKASLQGSAANEFMQESRIKTVACPDCIDGFYHARGAREAFCPALR
jgi:hypothetical protein